jgi:NADH-quinone oxidoreductase subunit N
MDINYSEFLKMIPEATLMLALVLVFCADFALHKNERKTFVLSVLTGALLLCQMVPCLLAEPASAFGGLYVTSPIVSVMKTVLTLGTFIVVVMSQSWLKNNATRLSGEFYVLVLSTLLGMYMMMSSGHFLMFFLGLEMASVPMACLVAFDRYKQKSAEAAAKYILTATFSSGVMLYGMFVAIVVPPAKADKGVLAAVVAALVLSCLFKWLPLLRNISAGIAIVCCTVIAAALCAWLFPLAEKEGDT